MESKKQNYDNQNQHSQLAWDCCYRAPISSDSCDSRVRDSYIPTAIRGSSADIGDRFNP